jgi:hypothetical protein
MIHRVGFWYTEGGFVEIEADTLTEAEDKVDELLDEYGLDAFIGANRYDNPQDNKYGLSNYEITHRDWEKVRE